MKLGFLCINCAKKLNQRGHKMKNTKKSLRAEAKKVLENKKLSTAKKLDKIEELQRKFNKTLK